MKDYKFSMDFWNDNHYKNFEKIASHFRKEQKPIDILEIGTFEGRTAFWLLDNIPNSRITVIDPHLGPKFKENFDKWALNNNQSRFIWVCNHSFSALIDEISQYKQYDLIYIDGCHCSSCVLSDAILSWKILKTNGILLFDDYNMVVEDNFFYVSHKEFETYKNEGCMWIHPKQAIDSFVAIYKGQYKMYIDNYQIGLQKICELGKYNLNHGHKNVGRF